MSETHQLSSVAVNMRQVPDLPQDWKRCDDLVIFFMDSFRCFEHASQLIKIYAIDTTDGTIYHVVDFPSPGDTYNGDLRNIGVVGYGTKIYAVGGEGSRARGIEDEANYQNTWICDIASSRQWIHGPPLLSGKYRPILFTMGHNLYVLESCPNTPFKVRFEVLNLLADVKNMTWKALQYSLALDSVYCLIEAFAIDEGEKRVYCKLVDYFRWTKFRWFVYDVINNEWGDFGPHDQPINLLSHNLMQTPDFHFSYILDGKTFIFDAPVHWDCEEKMSDSVEDEKVYDSGDLVLYNLMSGKDEVVKGGLKCPIDLGYQCLVYFVVQLQGGDICLVSFFPRHEYPAPQIGELIVYLIKSEDEEEHKNKQILSEPINRKLKSRSYKMVPVPRSELYSESYQGAKDGYWPRKIQQLSQLRCT